MQASNAELRPTGLPAKNKDAHLTMGQGVSSPLCDFQRGSHCIRKFRSRLAVSRQYADVVSAVTLVLLAAGVLKLPRGKKDPIRRQGAH